MVSSTARHHTASYSGSALTVPPGWPAVRGQWFRATDNRVEMTHVERPRTASRGAVDVARQHLEDVTLQGGELIHPAFQATALSGRSVIVQTFMIPDTGSGPLRLRAAYHVANDVETVVTVSAPDATEEAVAVADRLLRDYDPWPERSAAEQAGAPDVDPVAPESATLLGTFTSSELLALAGLAGIAALPSIVERPDPDVDRTLAGLLDTGVVGLDEAGNATIGRALKRAMRTVDAPAMVVFIESGPPGRTRRTILHIGSRSLVSVRQLDGNLLQVVTDSAERLGAHLIHHLDLRGIEDTDEEPVLLDGSQVERVRSGELSDDVATAAVPFARRVVRVRVLVGVSSGAIGDELTFVDSGTDGYWLVEQNEDVTSPAFLCRRIGPLELIAAVIELTLPPSSRSDR